MLLSLMVFVWELIDYMIKEEPVILSRINQKY